MPTSRSSRVARTLTDFNASKATALWPDVDWSTVYDNMTPEELHAVFRPPPEPFRFRGPAASYTPAGTSQYDVDDVHYPAESSAASEVNYSDLMDPPFSLQAHSDLVARESNPPANQPHRAEGVFNAHSSTGLNPSSPYPTDSDSPFLPQFLDFAPTFTKDEYTAIALCYDIYGLSSSPIISADPIFQTRKAEIHDLFWRLHTYDVLQTMKALENPGEYLHLSQSVSLHYTDMTPSTPSRIPIESTLLVDNLRVRLEFGDLAAKLLRANEDSLARRHKDSQGLRKWDHIHEERFRRRHGGPSPLKSIVLEPEPPQLFDLDLLESLFKQSNKGTKKSPTSSSSSYGTKSGYHSRSSSFSSSSHIPGTIHSGGEFPFGYPTTFAGYDELFNTFDTPATVSHVNSSPIPSLHPSRTHSPAHLSPKRDPGPGKSRPRKSKDANISENSKPLTPKDPNAPPKPPSAFLLFRDHLRSAPQRMQGVFGDETDPAKMGALAAKRWHAMSDAEKAPFWEQARLDMDRIEYEAEKMPVLEGFVLSSAVYDASPRAPVERTGRGAPRASIS